VRALLPRLGSVGLMFALLPSQGRAQESLGNTTSALPGVISLGVPGAARAGAWGVSASSGYGFTEAMQSETGSHHRLGGTVAVGFTPLRSLGLAVKLDGRFDSHPRDALGKDDGYAGEPRFIARYGQADGKLRLGGELQMVVPGREAPSIAFDAMTVDARGLLAYTPSASLLVSSAFGFRFDQSANAKPDLAQTRAGDRLALGLSDFNAVLAGVGVAWRKRNTEVLGEISADLLVGQGAPSLGASPMRAGVGVRQHLSRNLQLVALAFASPSSRPDMLPAGPLVPIEPRFAMSVGLSYRFGDREPADAHDAGSGLGVGSGTGDGAGDEPARAATVELVARVKDAQGRPVPGAEVSLASGLTGTTDAGGEVRWPAVPTGSLVARATAADFETAELTVEIKPGGLNQIDLVLSQRLSKGQLRGLIRSFRGKGLRAGITIEPGATRLESDADGSFEVDVPPGIYRVKIEAPGFGAQEREIRIEDNGVTVLNADLRKQERRGR
jgi:hypothetical protein